MLQGHAAKNLKSYNQWYLTMAQYGPLYTERHWRAINFLLVAGIAAVVVGLFAGRGITMLGVALAVYAWFTTPTRYLLFNDRLVIVYGRPRVRTVMYSQIEGVETLAAPVSGRRLRVLRRAGRSAWLTPRDPFKFLDHFREALEQFQAGSPEPDREPPAQP